MSTVVERRLGPEGVQWIRRSLVGTRLGSLIIARYSLDDGVVVAALPNTVSERQALSFETGGLIQPTPGEERRIVITHPSGSTSHLVPTPNADAYLVSMIQQFLRRAPSAICVFEDQVSQPGDPFVSLGHAPTSVIEGRVYHVLSSQRDDAETIRATIRAAKKGIHMMLGVLATRGAAANGISVDLEQAVGALDAIIVDAYDAESYLIWRPSPGPRK